MTLLTNSSSTRLRLAAWSAERRHSLANLSTRSPMRASSRRSLATTIESTRADGGTGDGSNGGSDIEPLQHLGGGLIELLRTANVLEPVQQVGGAQTLLLGPAEVMNDLAAVHHHEPVPQIRRL